MGPLQEPWIANPRAFRVHSGSIPRTIWAVCKQGPCQPGAFLTCLFDNAPNRSKVEQTAKKKNYKHNEGGEGDRKRVTKKLSKEDRKGRLGEVETQRRNNDKRYKTRTSHIAP